MEGGGGKNFVHRGAHCLNTALTIYVYTLAEILFIIIFYFAWVVDKYKVYICRRPVRYKR